MKKNIYPPILIVLFNRYNYSKKLISIINRNKFKKIYISVDGPRKKNTKDLENTKKIKKLISNTKWNSKIFLLYRKTNLGCALNIYKSIKFFFNREEFGIVLEDDCIPNKNFFKYMTYNLHKYKNNKKIGAISAINRRLISNNNNYNQYLSKFFGAWGWGSWRREIKNYKINIKLNKKTEEKLNKWIGLTSVSKNIINKAINGKKKYNTWDYQMNFLFLKNKKYTIRPSLDKIKNIGTLNTTHGNLFTKLPNYQTEKSKEFNHGNYNFFNDLFFYLSEFRYFNKFFKLMKILKIV
jgi:hypothetical protein